MRCRIVGIAAATAAGAIGADSSNWRSKEPQVVPYGRLQCPAKEHWSGGHGGGSGGLFELPQDPEDDLFPSQAVCSRKAEMLILVSDCG